MKFRGGRMKERKRKANLDTMTKEQAEEISAKLGQKISTILNNALEECNRITNVYQLQVKIGYEIVPIDKDK